MRRILSFFSGLMRLVLVILVTFVCFWSRNAQAHFIDKFKLETIIGIFRENDFWIPPAPSY